VTQSNARYRYAIDFSIDGDIRFISHNDMVRMFSRACARAALPASFTEGFNPRIRLALPFPRPTGQSSDVERAVVDLTERIDEKELLQRVQERVPQGIVLRHVTAMSSLTPCHATWVRYRVDIAPAQRERTTKLAEKLLASGPIRVTRVRHADGASKVVDIRPFIDAIDIQDEAVFVSVYVTNSGSAAPAEVCRALGLEADEISHLVRRVEIRWDLNQVKQPTSQ
jgi:radical SAM-linked protein